MNVQPRLRCKRSGALLGMYVALRGDSRFEVVLVDAATSEVLQTKPMSAWNNLCKSGRAGTLSVDKAPKSAKKSSSKKVGIPPAEVDDLLAGLE